MADTGSVEPGKPPPVASLERALDQVVDFLGRAEQSSRVRALVIEARRLRNIVGNWRSIAPPDDVREEMIARVLRLANDAEEISGAERPEMHEADAREESAPTGRRPEALRHAMASPEQAALEDTAGPPRVMTLTGPPAPARAPSLQMQAQARPPDLDLEMPGPSGGTLPFPPGGEQTEVNQVDGPEDRSLDGPTQAMHAVPDLPPNLWDDLQHGDAPRPPDLGSLPPIEGPPYDPGGAEPAPGPKPDPRGAEPSPPSYGDAARTLPRLPSLQFTRMPAPAPPLEAGRGLLPESAYLRGPSAIAPPTPPSPAIIEGPPSLRFDKDPPSSSKWDSEKTLTAIPVASFAIQPISVWSVPRPGQVDPEIVMLSDPYSKRADAYRALRRKLASGTARIIAVTSAMPKEGKTTCAINLAIALAETSPRNVLLVEANIRSPGLAAALKFDPPRCFAEQLRKRRKDPMEPWVVVEQTEQSDAPPPSQASSTRGRLHLLAMDPRAQRPPLLDGVSFSDGVQSLKRAGYEYIVLDTPPVMESMDMSVIGDSVDGVILTSLVKKSTRKALRQAMEQLKPAPVLGVVVLER